jgi:hypothetical protein
VIADRLKLAHHSIICSIRFYMHSASLVCICLIDTSSPR